MLTKEILKQVKLIEIKTRGIVSEIFSGEYHSTFKGRGMEFAEVREYQFGDDIRNIDWNVTARASEPFVKTFHEERELTLMLLVDISGSDKFGTFEKTKKRIIAEIAAVLAFSAIKNNDKVGLILFSSKIEKFIPPQKGKTHILRMIREILYFEPTNSETNISVALEHLLRVSKRKCISFLISDYFDKNYEKPLKIASKKHDLISIEIFDQKEYSLPKIGLAQVIDPETNIVTYLDTSNNKLRKNFETKMMKNKTDRIQNMKKYSIDHIDIPINKSYIDPLIKFFKMRAKRI